MSGQLHRNPNSNVDMRTVVVISFFGYPPHIVHLPTRVQEAVTLEVGLLSEALAAVGTPTRRSVGVRAEVCVQVGGTVEGLLTDGAHEGFDGGVCEAVTGQVARLAEGSATHLAPERLLSRVNALWTERDGE